ncbi:MAG: hypothetical protein KDI36_19265 [Pseudomonadales bacterium]|nr:hypothetical protein [Pseudomonadales bacterium]
MAAGMLAGCSHSRHYLQSDAPANGMVLSTTSDDAQVTYIKTAASDLRYCTETNIDYAQTESSGLSTSFGVKGASDSVGDQSADGVVSFGGRDPAVLIVRELMFRACEFNANMNADPRMALTVYAGTLDAIVKIAQSQQGTGTLPVAAAQTPAVSGAAGAGSDGSGADGTGGSGTTGSTSTLTGSALKPFDWSSAFDYSNDFNPQHP